MLIDHALNLMKLRLLRELDNYSSIEVREQQLATNLQVAADPTARPADIRQALDALADQDHAAKRKDPYRGWVWCITPAGHKAVRAIALEEDF